MYVYDRYNEKERPLLYKNLPSIKRARQTVGPSIAHFLSRAFALLPPTLSSFYILYVRVSIRNVCRRQGWGGVEGRRWIHIGKRGFDRLAGINLVRRKSFCQHAKGGNQEKSSSSNSGQQKPPPPWHHPIITRPIHRY